MEDDTQETDGTTQSDSDRLGNFRNGSDFFEEIPNRSEGLGRVLDDSQPRPEIESSENTESDSDFDGQSNDSNGFGQVPQLSEIRGTMRKNSENVRKVRNGAEFDAKEADNHTLTVTEVTRMFAESGVPRTERSVVNWCHANRHGISRLNCFLDTNEGKYFITPESVDLAIKEEQARAAKNPNSAAFEKFQRHGKPVEERETESERGDEGGSLRATVQRMELDIKIKEGTIEHLMKERNGLFDRIEQTSQNVGRLKERVLQLEGPESDLLQLLDGGEPPGHVD